MVCYREEKNMGKEKMSEIQQILLQNLGPVKKNISLSSLLNFQNDEGERILLFFFLESKTIENLKSCG